MDPAVSAHIDSSERWSAELAAIRPVLLRAGLSEAVKWRSPCYSIEGGGNVALLQEMKDHLALMFFQGALLADPDDVLEAQGPNSRSAKRVRFTSVDDVERLSDSVAALLDEAVAAARAGLRVEPGPELELVDELRERLDSDPELRAAFEELTPGRRREYHLHVSGAKRAETRRSRVERCVPMILAGRGLRDR